MKLVGTPSVAKSLPWLNWNSGQPLSNARGPLVPGIPRTPEPIFFPKPGCSDAGNVVLHAERSGEIQLGCGIVVDLRVYLIAIVGEGSRREVVVLGPGKIGIGDQGCQFGRD